MLINGIHFRIYNSDDEISITERLAASLSTSPKWLVFGNMDGPDLVNSTRADVVDILSDIRSRKDEFEQFSEMESEYASWISAKGSKELLAKLAIIFKLEGTEYLFSDKILLEQFFFEQGGTDFGWEFIETTISESEIFLEEIKKNILDVKRRSDNRTEQMKREDVGVGGDEQVSLETSPFVITNTVTTLTIETDKSVVLERIMDLAEDTTFAKVGNVVKTDGDACISSDRHAVFALGPKEFHIDYIDRKHLLVDVDTPAEDGDFEEDLRKLFRGIEIKILNTNSFKIKGVFEIRTEAVRKEVLMDVIMNNSQFFSMYVGERSRISRNFRVQVYFYSVKTGPVQFSIGGSSPIIVKLSGIKNLEDAEYVKKTVLKLILVCKGSSESIIQVYTSYDQRLFAETEEDDDENDKPRNNVNRSKNVGPAARLSNLEPSLFIPLYTRKCAKPPRALEEGEEAMGSSIEFPIRGEGGIVPRRYACDQYTTFKFPGLRVNSLRNADVFKYVPCCFETDQIAKNSSALNAYLKNEQKGKNPKKIRRIYKTAKILGEDDVGSIPVAFSKMFPEDAKLYGVPVSPNSFIDCVARSVNRLPEKSESALRRIRSELDYRFCLQENFDIPDFKSWFENPNLYFEPRRFFRALEEYFDVDIYVFERFAPYVTGYSEGELTWRRNVSTEILAPPNIPPYGSYVIYPRRSRFVCVFLHSGSSTDAMSFPHCEMFSACSKSAPEVYFKMISPVRVVLRPRLLNDSSEQIVDSSGRVYALKDRNGATSKLEEPVPPLGLPIAYREDSKLGSFSEWYLSRLRTARVFIDYCLVKCGREDVEQFLDKFSVIVPGYEYPRLTGDPDINYLDRIFSRDGKIIFESQDTRERIEYTMKIIVKKNGPVLPRDFCLGYYSTPEDFDGTTFSFKKFIEYSQGSSLKTIEMINEIFPVKFDITILVTNDFIPELNGRFRRHSGLSEGGRETEDSAIRDKIFIWSGLGFDSYETNGSGKIIMVYKMNSVTYFLHRY